MMDNNPQVAQNTPTVPDIPQTPPKTSLSLIQETWKKLTGQQKATLIGLVVIVLGVGVGASLVLKRQLFPSQAVTPPVTPPTTPTPKPSPFPTPYTLGIITSSFPDGIVGTSYRVFFYGEAGGYTKDPSLSFTVKNLPPGIKFVTSLCGTSYPTDRPQSTKRIDCALDGKPTRAGKYSVTITITDTTTGQSVSKVIPLIIKSKPQKPIPIPSTEPPTF